MMWPAEKVSYYDMVHEYVEDLAVLSNALVTGHGFVPALIDAAEKMIHEIAGRGWD